MIILKCPSCGICFGCILIPNFDHYNVWIGQNIPIYCEDCIIPRTCGRACSPIIDGFNVYAPELCPTCKKEILDDYQPI